MHSRPVRIIFFCTMVFLSAIPAMSQFSHIYQVPVEAIDAGIGWGQTTVYNHIPGQTVTWGVEYATCGCQYTSSCNKCPSVRISPESGTLQNGATSIVDVTVTSQSATPGEYQTCFRVVFFC